MDDGDDDTTYTAGTGLALSGTNVFSLSAGIGDLSDVDMSTAPVLNQLLSFDGTN